MSARPRALAPDDRKRILHTANEWARSGSFTGLRTRAFVHLALGSGLRLKELCALNLTQVLDRTARGWRLRSQAYLLAPQSKGRRNGARKKWDSAGSFYLTKNTRTALTLYLREARKRGWIEWPPAADTPLFVTVKGRGSDDNGADHHVRLSHRTAQHAWTLLQARARVTEPYGVHCLRHEALSRFADACGGDSFKVAKFGRCDLRTALRYVHLSPAELERVAERAQHAIRARQVGIRG
ncbi:MAG: tyrosine-type recombinase/integrase [Candidatus Nanopelagicales bacterium]